ncbi:SMP-30/gluconolactonase/LRE family protein [Pseudonocardia spinosispora]|uniref:SMP-30/gluconolactonase/LRE family protein n=1 Tax=Pseudonocardia spinosispora TaxID=103441 RepID=UPI00056369AC|nr:SMP-30/gluconolactonase/LRE family protein [Pseudonocardia spinosispora]
MTTVRTVADGFSFLEGPRWHDGRLWASDFYTRRVVAIDESGTVETIAEVPQQPSGLGWLPDGRLLVVSMRDHRLLRQESDGSLVEHADLSGLTDFHLNDMLVDGTGRAYIGDFGFDLMSGAAMRPGRVSVVGLDGSARVAAPDMEFPNGMALVDGGATLVAAETFGNRLTAFTLGSDGELTDRRVWASFGPEPTSTDVHEAMAALAVAPDGICAGADNTIWVADAVGRRAIQVAEGGEIVAEVSSGDLHVFACALGGANGNTLFLCAAPSFAEHERKDTREAVVLAAEV